MPELPEVHTITSDLNKHISGSVIKDIKITKGYKTHPDNSSFIKALKGKNIVGVSRLAKNILIKIDDGGTIHFHLAMTGRILLKYNDTEDKWTKVTLLLKNDKIGYYLKFTDMRTFGKAVYYPDFSLSGLDSKYGPDLINNPPNIEMFSNAVNKHNTSIKNALLDQTVIAGLGNIYATEALFIAGIDPTRSTKTLSAIELSKLLGSCVLVLKEGIKYRGSTLPDKMYVDVFGKSGSYQDHFKIYLKKNCPNCDTKVLVKKIGGRSTYYCPKCQK